MDTKRLAIGTIVGCVVLYILGILIFAKAFGAFYAAHAGSATGVTREPQILWALLVGSAAYAALITLAIGTRGGAPSAGAGAMTGAVVGLLIWMTADFIFFGSMNISDITIAFVDPALEFVRGGITGAVIAVALGMVPPAGAAKAA
jgi:hypothetical protein